MLRSFLVRIVFAALWIGTNWAFVPMTLGARQHHCFTPSINARRGEEEESFLLQEFRTHSGEILNPYATLKVSRTAELSEIKTSYRNLSRRYHPDVMRHKDILPGSCNNMEEVRDEWERIKLSYEILKDKKTRRRYDRHEMLSDPNAAMKRAAFDAMGKGMQSVGKGIFDIGVFAMNQMRKDDKNGVQEEKQS